MTIIKGMLGSAALLAALSVPLQAAEPVKVGSKIDTEGALLGNIILQVLESHGVKTVNKVQLGTTPVVRGAITSGDASLRLIAGGKVQALVAGRLESGPQGFPSIGQSVRKGDVLAYVVPSSGQIERRSMISASMPVSIAARSATQTMVP